MNNPVIATIYVGYKIQVGNETYTVRSSCKARTGYKYFCTTLGGKKVTIDRKDLLQAQAEGSATVLAA